MKCISIKQPWADLILYAGKNVENRTWATNVRGRVLIHASKSHEDYDMIWRYLTSEWIMDDNDRWQHWLYWDIAENNRCGLIVGSVEIVDCVRKSESAWFEGPCGFMLANPIAFKTPIPYRGRLGFFEVPAAILPEVA